MKPYLVDVPVRVNIWIRPEVSADRFEGCTIGNESQFTRPGFAIQMFCFVFVLYMVRYGGINYKFFWQV